MIDSHAPTHAYGAMSCGEAMSVLWDFLDGELSDERAAAIRAHLEACRPCHKHHEFERAFLEAVAAARETDPAPPALRSRVTTLLRERGLLS